MLNDWQKKRLALSAWLMGAFTLVEFLGGCSSQLADLRPDEVQPKEAGTYLPVNDVPPARDQDVISPEQRAKIEAELQAARDRQAAIAADAK